MSLLFNVTHFPIFSCCIVALYPHASQPKQQQTNRKKSFVKQKDTEYYINLSCDSTEKNSKLCVDQHRQNEIVLNFLILTLTS